MYSFVGFEDDLLTWSSTAHAFKLERLLQDDLGGHLIDDAAMVDFRDTGGTQPRMRLVGRHALIDHRDPNTGNKLLDAARILARTLRRNTLSSAQMTR